MQTYWRKTKSFFSDSQCNSRGAIFAKTTWTRILLGCQYVQLKMKNCTAQRIAHRRKKASKSSRSILDYSVPYGMQGQSQYLWYVQFWWKWKTQWYVIICVLTSVQCRSKSIVLRTKMKLLLRSSGLGYFLIWLWPRKRILIRSWRPCCWTKEYVNSWFTVGTFYLVVIPLKVQP